MLSWTCGDVPRTPSLDGKPILGANPGSKPGGSALPILVVLFVISYSLMTLLVFEQGRTIESQRALIRSLFQDSSQLSRLRKQAIQTQRAEAQAQAEAQEHAQVKTPSTQDKNQKKPGPNTSKAKPVPPHPDADDVTLVRRFVITI
ncbi:MAG TPA: hypothetical protein VEK33_04550 [Terriglobales bacterium]|nr:hypothetical protein [Terriglobales bacterium]